MKRITPESQQAFLKKKPVFSSLSPNHPYPHQYQHQQQSQHHHHDNKKSIVPTPCSAMVLPSEKPMLQALPVELLQHIFGYLSFRDLVQFYQSSLYWYRRLSKIPSLWINLPLLDHSSSSGTMQRMKIFIDRSKEQLSQLSMSQCNASVHIGKLWTMIYTTRLSELRLHKFVLDDFQTPMTRSLTCLTFLELHSCRISEKALLEILDHTPNIQTLQIVHCSYTVAPYYSQAERNAVLPIKRLEHLQYTNNTGTVDKVFCLSRLFYFIVLQCNLDSLALNGCHVPVRLLQGIFHSCAKTGCLSRLDLNKSRLGYPQAATRESMHEFSLCFGLLAHLRVLRLANVDFLDIPALLSVLVELEELDLSYQNQQVTDAVLLSFLQLSPHLVSLSLEGCQRLSTKGLMAALEEADHLTHLNVSAMLVHSESLLTFLVSSRQQGRFMALTELVLRWPTGLTSGSLIAFVRAFGASLSLLDIGGQTSVPLDIVGFCRKLLPSSCKFIF